MRIGSGGLFAGDRAVQAEEDGMATKVSDLGRRVAVFGGGPGGMTAAHELAERGYEVDLYERHQILGGKCRSFGVPGSGTDGRADLPGELGPHVYFGAYEHLGHTLQRIPVGDGRTVLDNLTIGGRAARSTLCFRGDTISLPFSSRHRWSQWLNPRTILLALVNARRAFKDIPRRDFALLASKVLAVYTSGPQRQWKQLEYLPLSDFLRTERLSERARELVEVAIQAQTPPASRMNTRLFSEGLLRPMVADYVFKRRSSTLRELYYSNSGPTNEIWFDPWAEHLTSLGVKIHTGQQLVELSTGPDAIASATVTDHSGRRIEVVADHYVLAMPADKVAPLISEQIAKMDPALGRIERIEPTWLGAIQIYLKKPQPKIHMCTMAMSSPWTIFAVNVTNKMWRRDFPDQYGDGSVVGNISVDMAGWDTKGILYGKSAKECTPQELFEEAVAQIRRDLDDETVLAEDAIHSWFMNPAISESDAGILVNDEPLFATPPGHSQFQPDAVTRIPNLYLASSYVKSARGVDSMDGANEAGKRAANGILDATGDTSPRAPIHSAEPPALLRWLRARDDRRYARGLPNIFDRVNPLRP
jgi:uncharacterized protein with NAD-binding domain and iron-sulfur cluster